MTSPVPGPSSRAAEMLAEFHDHPNALGDAPAMTGGWPS